jgi:hypothetical protein
MSIQGMADALRDLGESIDILRRELNFLDISVLSRSTRREFAAQYRSSCYVWAAAALETYVHRVTEEMSDELNHRNVVWRDVRPSVLSLALASRFDSLQQIRGLAMWRKRAEVLKSINLDDVCSFNMEVAPSDGKTIRPAHLETLWEVFGFSGVPMPSPIHRMALEELADNRNELAHGRRDFVAFGRLKVTDDILRLLDRVEDIAIHLFEAADSYLSTNDYLR